MIHSRNGEFKGEGEPQIEEKAVFETMRTYNGKVFRLDDHLTRLFESAKGREMTSTWTVERVRDGIEEILKQAPWINESESKVRVILTADELFVTAEALPEKSREMYEKGIKAIRYDGHRHNAEIKGFNDPHSAAAKKVATDRGVYEAVMVDEEGHVGECAHANLFWVKNGKLFTTDRGVLKGITRQTVIELEGGCEFTDIRYENLLEADEVFITQTTSGILPLVEIEGQKIDSGTPGIKTKELMVKFRELTSEKGDE